MNFIQAFSGNYPQKVSNDRKHLEITFPNLFIGEARDILVKVSVPACTTPIDKYAILNAKVQYTSIVDGQMKQGVADVTNTQYNPLTPEIAPCYIKRCIDTEIKLEDVNIDVDTQKNRQLLIETMEQVTKLAERNQYQEATDVLTKCEETIKKSVSITNGSAVCLSILDDLKDSKAKVANNRTFRDFGGSAQLSEYSDTYAKQRKVYSKSTLASSSRIQAPDVPLFNPYQNLSSRRGQTTANASKSMN